MLLKFNAYDKTAKEYINFDDFAKQFMTFPCEMTHNEVLSEFLATYSHCKILPFTGLKDSKGVDLYDSDIIKVGDTYLEIKYIANCGSFKALEHKDNYLYNIKEIADSNFEIVGNIYENKKLLGE